MRHSVRVMPMPAVPHDAPSRDDVGIIRSAVFSPDRRYRYHLSRVWPFGRGSLCFIMLNPSHADEAADDATIRKCMGFAKRFGYGGIDVVNLYAHAARYPKDLRAAGYPVGPHNDDWIHTTSQATHRGGGHVVCAWGHHARGLPRADEVIRIVRSCGIDPLVLDRCACGTPAHPLLLRYSCQLQPL
jgi:hypothetical protein